MRGDADIGLRIVYWWIRHVGVSILRRRWSGMGMLHRDEIRAGPSNHVPRRRPREHLWRLWRRVSRLEHAIGHGRRDRRSLRRLRDMGKGIMVLEVWLHHGMLRRQRIFPRM